MLYYLTYMWNLLKNFIEKRFVVTRGREGRIG